MNEKILIIDDEQDICMLIQGLLEDEGYETLTAANSDQAYALIESESPDLIIQDIWLQGSEDDGMQILKNTKKEQPHLPFIMISGHGTIETAVSSIKIGAYDFIEKPFKSDRLLLMIHRALENADLIKQNVELKQLTTGQNQDLFKQIPENILQTLDKVANTNSRILITGEAGSGKNISAHYIHDKSARAELPFMTLNCTAHDIDKLEIELFGSTSASGYGAKAGLLELVNGGTLLLDEVMELPVETQGKILMLLQESAYHKIGSNSKTPVDIRVIATTSADVEQKLSSGDFREDLYYRLNVVPIDMPPLRQRKQDIPDLIKHYSSLTFSENAVAKLQSYRWPGNMKQLNNILEWLAIMSGDNQEKVIDIEDLPPEFSGHAVNENNQDSADIAVFIDSVMQMKLREAREYFERHYLLSQINKFDGNVSKTAEFIGMERSALHRKLKSLEVFSDDKQNVA